MKISFEILELIKRYARGEANEDERTMLEKMLQEQPELQEELDLAKLLVEKTQEVEMERIMQTIRQVDNASDKEETVSQDTSSSIFSNKKIWWIVAGLVAILLALLAWWKMQTPPKEKQIYAFQEEAYLSPSNGNLLRGAATKSTLDNAYREFFLKNYDQSLQVLEVYSEQDSLYLEALYLKAHNHFQSKNYTQAITTFDEIISKQTQQNFYTPNIDNVGWTRILAMLAAYHVDKNENQKVELKKQLSDFIKETNATDIYYEKAIELEKLLEN